MKGYFLHSPGQEKQFKLYFTPSPGFLKKCVPPPCYYTPYYQGHESSSTVVSACVTHESHCLDNMFFKIIAQDDDWTNQGYKEATAIEMLKLDLNVDEGRCCILLSVITYPI